MPCFLPQHLRAVVILALDASAFGVSCQKCHTAEAQSPSKRRGYSLRIGLDQRNANSPSVNSQSGAKQKLLKQ
jgi:hypothetical protein